MNGPGVVGRERLQKVLAGRGLGSRRQIEGWIREGRLTIDGRTATLGDRVGPRDRVCLDGQRIDLENRAAMAPRVIAYHKPVGEVCTRRDPEGRPSVFAALPGAGRGRWILIGRLDINTSGLLLLSNDGELAHRLMHPSHAIEREYAVRVRGEVDEACLRRLRQGVELDDGRAAFDSVRDAGGTGSNHWYHVVLREGRKREVRRLWESQGLQVSRLTRVRFGGIVLPRSLPPGQWRELEAGERDALYLSVGLPAPTTPAGDDPGRGAKYRATGRQDGRGRRRSGGAAGRYRGGGQRRRR